jgi:hypothetical protein
LPVLSSLQFMRCFPTALDRLMSRYSQGTISLEKNGWLRCYGVQHFYMQKKYNRTSMGAIQKYTLETGIQIGYNKRKLLERKKLI